MLWSRSEGVFDSNEQENAQLKSSRHSFVHMFKLKSLGITGELECAYETSWLYCIDHLSAHLKFNTLRPHASPLTDPSHPGQEIARAFLVMHGIKAFQRAENSAEWKTLRWFRVLRGNKACTGEVGENPRMIGHNDVSGLIHSRCDAVTSSERNADAS